MDRLKKTKDETGLTLIELLIALILLTVVLITASSMLSSFHKFYHDFGQNSGSITEVSLSVLEEIVNKINTANRVTIGASDDGTANARIDIRIDEANTASDPNDDTTYTYQKVGAEIKYQKSGGAQTTVARNIGLLSFEFQPAGSLEYNRVRIIVGILPSPGGKRQDFETTVLLRCHDTGISG